MSGGIVRLKDQISRPTKIRTCSDCGNPILRNNVRTPDGLDHHWGCLKKDHAQPAFVCCDCATPLTRAQAPKLFVSGIMSRGCGVCGSTNVRPYAEHAQGFEVVRS